MQEDQDNLRMELKAKDTMLELAKTEKERIISKFQTEAGDYPTCSIPGAHSLSLSKP